MKGRIIEIIVGEEVKGKYRLTDLHSRNSRWNETKVECEENKPEFTLSSGEWDFSIDALKEIINRKATRMYGEGNYRLNDYETEVEK